jgi:hypothetical protein
VVDLVGDDVSGTKVTCTDVDTGESESKVIENDWMIVTDGTYYLDGIATYPKSGTVVLTVKRRKVEPQ